MNYYCRYRKRYITLKSCLLCRKEKENQHEILGMCIEFNIKEAKAK